MEVDTKDTKTSSKREKGEFNVMNILRKIFNLGLLKLFLALTILFGIVGLVYYAQHRAEVAIKEFGTEQAKDKNANSEAIVVDNYELKEIGEDNELHWKLTAIQGTMEPNTKDVKLKDVVVKYFKEGKVSMRLQAPVGTANELTRIIILAQEGSKKVMMGGDEKQAQLETSKLELTKNNQFIATGGVNIVLPGVAKVSGNTAEGKFADANLDTFVIRGNTHASIGI